MTREIKFRIWSTSLNRIVYNPYVKEIYRERDQINDFFNGKNNKFTWMQYTGSKDKKNREIYESDIILRDNSHDDIHIIEFHNNMFGWWETWDDEKEFTVISGWAPNERLEVVGNIYEHKNLLEIKQKEKHYTFTD